jgi:hypothetical protein
MTLDSDNDTLDNDTLDNGKLDKFHLGVSADGRSCMMIFLDEAQHAIRCTADFAQFNAFITNLNRAAAEMARRRNALGDEEPTPSVAMNVTFAEFQLSRDDDYIEGALIGDSGEIVGIRMHPDVAYQMTKAVLNTALTVSRN